MSGADPLFLDTGGLGRYEGFFDKTWGLVDCVSFEVMLDHDSRDAFTPDRHFEQAGFRRQLSRSDAS